ncbi:MAG: glycine cleavage T C-terminal barrel domain-containing protein, partial [Pseudomonadota bacterium]
LSWAVGKKKDDFVGIRGLMRPDLVKSGRRQLVGLKLKNGETVLEEGAQIVETTGQVAPREMIGWVYSAYWSENCGHPIALALVENGFNRTGETLYASAADDGFVEVEVCGTQFFDPEGGRVNG